MQREFLKERTRCRALEEELENPMNVHRWRKLEVPPAGASFLLPPPHSLKTSNLKQDERFPLI